MNHFRKAAQRGTLIARLGMVELLLVVAIFCTVAYTSFSLYDSARSSWVASSWLADLTSLRSSIRSIYYATSGYGPPGESLVEPLVVGNKVPPGFDVAGVSPKRVLKHQWGLLQVVSNTTTFTVRITTVPSSVCERLLASSTGWRAARVGKNPVRVPPVDPDLAASDCGEGRFLTVDLVGG